MKSMKKIAVIISLLISVQALPLSFQELKDKAAKKLKDVGSAIDRNAKCLFKPKENNCTEEEIKKARKIAGITVGAAAGAVAVGVAATGITAATVLRKGDYEALKNDIKELADKLSNADKKKLAAAREKFEKNIDSYETITDYAEYVKTLKADRNATTNVDPINPLKQSYAGIFEALGFSTELKEGAILCFQDFINNPQDRDNQYYIQAILEGTGCKRSGVLKDKMVTIAERYGKYSRLNQINEKNKQEEAALREGKGVEIDCADIDMLLKSLDPEALFEQFKNGSPNQRALYNLVKAHEYEPYGLQNHIHPLINKKCRKDEMEFITHLGYKVDTNKAYFPPQAATEPAKTKIEVKEVKNNKPEAKQRSNEEIYQALLRPMIDFYEQAEKCADKKCVEDALNNLNQQIFAKDPLLMSSALGVALNNFLLKRTEPYANALVTEFKKYKIDSATIKNLFALLAIPVKV